MNPKRKGEVTAIRKQIIFHPGALDRKDGRFVQMGKSAEIAL
jgi:hypothetical protein